MDAPSNIGPLRQPDEIYAPLTDTLRVVRSSFWHTVLRSKVKHFLPR